MTCLVHIRKKETIKTIAVTVRMGPITMHNLMIEGAITTLYEQVKKETA